MMKKAVNDNKIGGAVALVAKNGYIVYHKAFGKMDISPERPMRDDTIFRIASMTKPITATAVMILVDEGKIALDDPVSKYIPQFKNPKVLIEVEQVDEKTDTETYTYRLEPAKREITIRHLLTHTSGITYRFFGADFFEEIYTNAGISDGLTQTEGTIGAMVKRLAKLPLIDKPGDSWNYGLSNDVLGYLVEVVSGMSFDQFLQKRIFKKLNMKDTYFFLPDEKVSRLSALWEPNGRGGIKKASEEPKKLGAHRYSASYHYKGPKTHFSGGAGLVSTAMDYTRFLQMLVNRGDLDGVRLLKTKTVDMMTTNQIGKLDTLYGTKYGFGVGVDMIKDQTGKEIGIHTYYWGGYFHTRFRVTPKEKLIMIMLTQLFPSDVSIERDFYELVEQSLFD
jgi:CubicO group peptidase (beta-lactamase class C family)